MLVRDFLAWYAGVMEIECESCGRRFKRRGERGRVPRFCGQTCRKRASRQPWKKLVAVSEGRWVRADGKRPIMRDGSPASSTDPETWTSFKNVRGGAGDGFGVMLGGGLGCYDLDHVIVDGVLEDWVPGFVESIPEHILFMETSMSGTGLHIFFKAHEGRGYRRGQVERYSKSRFIRTTLKEFTL